VGEEKIDSQIFVKESLCHIALLHSINGYTNLDHFGLNLCSGIWPRKTKNEGELKVRIKTVAKKMPFKLLCIYTITTQSRSKLCRWNVEAIRGNN
jgi:hypothetical protein